MNGQIASALGAVLCQEPQGYIGLFYGRLFARYMAHSYNRIDLENLIFARAAQVHASVDGVRGEWVSPSGDIVLQVLISVYNAFFAEENKRFLAESQDRAETVFWLNFAAEYRAPAPLVRAYGVPFFKKDFQAELFWLSFL